MAMVLIIFQINRNTDKAHISHSWGTSESSFPDWCWRRHCSWSGKIIWHSGKRQNTNTYIVKYSHKQYISPIWCSWGNISCKHYWRICQKGLELIIHGLLIAFEHLTLPEDEHKSIQKWSISTHVNNAFLLFLSFSPSSHLHVFALFA